MLDDCDGKQVMQRAKGSVDLGFDQGGLQRMYQSGSAKVILPKVQSPMPEAVLINTAGGMTSGDAFSYRVSVEQASNLVVTTQAAERIYQGLSDPALLDVDLSVTGGSALHWMPQETILFDRSKLRRQLTAQVSDDSELLIVEPVFFGRSAMGEVLDQVHFTDTWRVYQGAKLIHAEATRLTGDVANMMQRKACANGALAMATVLYVASDAVARLDQARALLTKTTVEAAASAWGGKLVLRFLAKDAAAMRRDVMRFLTEFRGADIPRVWQM